MAKDRTPDSRMIYQRTPAQAHRVFGFDGDRYDGGNDTLGAPRQKYLFLVRFVRGTAEGKQSEWENGLSFACKRFDRPRVSFETQVLNQYNKKRIVQTGVKYNPVRIEYHDTADQSVMQMWHEYSSYYFGDFRKVNATDWTYDIVNPDYQDAGKEGFGLTLPQESNSTNNPSSFFTALECYQFSGGSYTQFDLVNPKIISFDPDEMDYGSDVGHGLTMTLDYEAIIYKNSNKPLSMKDASASPFIKSLLTNRYFNGDVHEPEDTSQPSAQSRFNNGVASLLPGSVTKATPWETVSVTPVTPGSRESSSSGSALGAFGSFNFGSASAITSGLLKQPGLIQSVVGGNLKGAKDQILNGYKQNALNSVLDSAFNPAKATSGVNAALFDVARGSAQSIVNGGGGLTNATKQWAAARVGSSVIGSLIDKPKKDSGGDDWI